MLIRSLIISFVVGLSILSTALIADERPNIVLIIGDDIGYSDIGCYGAEIETPRLDALAANGMRFSQAYNMAKCNPTRSSMLTGTLLGGAECQSMGGLLREAGYTTLYSGKEHFDTWVPLERLTAMNNFDKSFCHYGGCGNFFSYEPVEIYLNDRLLTQEEIEAGTSKPYYKTNAYTDFALRFLEETKDDGKPFFLYLPYESAHYPLQTLPEDYEKFEALYEQGWDAIRDARFEKQKAMGLIPKDTKLPALIGEKDDIYQPWEEVSEEDRQRRIEEFAGFAGMVHALDRNIGRVVDWIDEQGELDNTLILFLSDNGGCGIPGKTKNWLHPTDPKSWRSPHAVLGMVSSTPFRKFKQAGHEGGARTHLIAHWPDKIAPNQISHTVAHLVDFMPTFLEMAEAEYPSTQDGKPTPQLDGLSLVPVFEGEDRPDHGLLITGWTERKRAIRKGDWKLVRDGKEWQLYDMAKDPTEMNDLAKQMPEKVESLLKAYADWRADRPYLPEAQKVQQPYVGEDGV
ncbi:MAG: arylsulfatase [Verrucomicrobiota bacterium]